MRHVVLNIAMSLDGYIADEQGGFDWIKGHDNHDIDSEVTFDFAGFLQGVDTIVMGSKSYEDCVLSGLETFSDHQIFVVTSRIIESRDNVRFIKEDIKDQIRQLKSMKGRDIWLFGGAKLVDSLVQANLIDAYIIGVIPQILGKGRRLFEETDNDIPLTLNKTLVNDGITFLFYTPRIT